MSAKPHTGRKIPGLQHSHEPADDLTLYCKAGPDGKSVGDCPFAHCVRMVLHEKGLSYELCPCTQETKPEWLVEHFDGKMPALRHRQECYTESEVIAQYLDYYFEKPPLAGKKKHMVHAKQAFSGLFPAMAAYFKHRENGSREDKKLQSNLEDALRKLNDHLDLPEGRTGHFIVGDGEAFTLVDCSLAPMLYILETGLAELKGDPIDLATDYTAIRDYMDAVFDRPSFKRTKYPKEFIVWGWSSESE